jgi:mono/diheme cytochrome c family protein
MKTILFVFLLSVMTLMGSACGAAPAGEQRADAPAATEVARRMGGPGSGMMARHQAPIPEPYAGMTNPVASDEASLTRGGEHYAQYCLSCHGEGGMGDGPAGSSFDPPPAPIAHTSRMLGDDYLYWRISEGGSHEPFASVMPRWQDVLDENDRWDVINYVRALGNGTITPGRGMGTLFDPAAEAAQHEAMAAAGVLQGVLTQEEADIFVSVHALMDAQMGAGRTGSGGMDAQQTLMLAELVATGEITQAEADMFSRAHEALMGAELMQ